MPRIEVVANVLKANDTIAAINRQTITAAGATAFNLLSAPGSGKTTLLQKTIAALAPTRCAVLVGDLQTSRDAERLAADTADAVQINTGRGCHLSAEQVTEGLTKLPLQGVRYVFIENIGNMVCPVSFDLGEHRRVVLYSIPEGDDKVAKYPLLFQCADIILLTKVDLLGILDFDLAKVKADLAQVNTHAPLLHLSTKTGEGVTAWLEWLAEQRPNRQPLQTG